MDILNSLQHVHSSCCTLSRFRKIHGIHRKLREQKKMMSSITIKTGSIYFFQLVTYQEIISIHMYSQLLEEGRKEEGREHNRIEESKI